MSAYLRKLHATGGILLGGYACFHAFVQYAALEGRDAWLDRMQQHRLGLWLGTLVVLAIAGHAALGVWRFSEHRKALRAGTATADARLGFQLVVGLLLAAFVVVHLVQVWPPAHGPSATLLTTYQTLWSSLGRPALLVSYVVGVTALAFHFGLGLLRLTQPASGPNRARYVVGVLGVLLWLSYLQVVARFAIGEALVPTGTATGATATPEDDGAQLDH